MDQSGGRPIWGSQTGVFNREGAGLEAGQEGASLDKDSSNVPHMESGNTGNAAPGVWHMFWSSSVQCPGMREALEAHYSPVSRSHRHGGLCPEPHPLHQPRTTVWERRAPCHVQAPGLQEKFSAPRRQVRSAQASHKVRLMSPIWNGAGSGHVITPNPVTTKGPCPPPAAPVRARPGHVHGPSPTIGPARPLS